MVILLPLLDLFVFHFSCAKYTNSIHIKRKFLKQRRSYWYGPDHLNTSISDHGRDRLFSDISQITFDI